MLGGNTMKETPYVFLSWSGDQSRKIAELFQTLFNHTFEPTINSFVSSRDIRGGSRSISELFKKLQICNYGICFINSDNVRAPWIQFEAGALSKIVDESRVMILLLDEKCLKLLDDTPLREFQHKLFYKEHIKSIFEEVIEKFGLTTSKESFMYRFESGWEEFNNKSCVILKENSEVTEHIQQLGHADKEEWDMLKKMLLNIQNSLKTEYSQSIKESKELVVELRKIVKSMSPEDLKDMKMQFKVQRYELVFQQNIGDIEEVIDSLENESEKTNNPIFDNVKEKLNNIIGRTMSLIDD